MVKTSTWTNRYRECTMLSGQRNKYKLSNANTAFILQKHLKSFAPHHRKKRKKKFERKKNSQN